MSQLTHMAEMPSNRWAGNRPRIRNSKLRIPNSRGFTLIEIMIVVGIIGIVLAAGIPAMFRNLKKDALRQAVTDLVEGCSYARSHAIMSGVPAEFRIRADGALIVPRSGDSSAPKSSGDAGEGFTGSSIFQRRLDRDVAIELINLNFKERMGDLEVRVRFYPNGTADEFTVIITSTQGSFKISTDVVSGLADAERLR